MVCAGALPSALEAKNSSRPQLGGMPAAERDQSQGGASVVHVQDIAVQSNVQAVEALAKAVISAETRNDSVVLSLFLAMASSSASSLMVAEQGIMAKDVLA